MLTWHEYRQIRRHQFGENRTDSKYNFKRYKEAKMSKISMDAFCNYPIELAPLPKAVLCDDWSFKLYKPDTITCKIQEEGKTPMRTYENNAYANASVQAPKSDAAVQRDYLSDELTRAYYPKETQLQKLFNLYVDNTPKTYKDMIAIIQAGTYTIDPKRIDDAIEPEDDDFPRGRFSPTYGIIWPGPVADWDGYRAAQKDMEKQMTAAKRIIVTGDAAAGLAALQAFEAWVPTPATPAS